MTADRVPRSSVEIQVRKLGDISDMQMVEEVLLDGKRLKWAEAEIVAKAGHPLQLRLLLSLADATFSVTGD